MDKKLYIKTFGCQMNLYDSGRMADSLAPLGYRLTQDPQGADMVILNTCHIREKAAEKIYSELGRLKHLKRAQQEQSKGMVVAVTGCVAQAEGQEIFRRAPLVDLVVGPQSYHRLPELVAKVARGAGGVLDTDFPVESKFDHLPEESRPPGPAAFLSVQEGCDKFCTFCVVPYTRGAEFSRPVLEVLREARRLVAAGAVELTLLGQNVNAYHGEGPDRRDWTLGRLIRELAEIEGLLRLRYTTSHPREVDADLISAHAEVGKLMPYLHLPVQSGSDRILAAMNRQHTSDDYRRVVGRLRDAVPALALSSDFIVGFPGETRRDFAETLRLVNEIGYAQAYSFKYSPRPGTPAAAEGDQVPESDKSDRLASLQQLIATQQMAFNTACVGREMPVLFEGRGRKPDQLMGRSPFMHAVHATVPTVSQPRFLGRVVTVRITTAHPNSLGGDLAILETTENEGSVQTTVNSSFPRETEVPA